MPMAYKLAISNIAWPTEYEDEVLGILDRHGVGDIEIALQRSGRNRRKPIWRTCDRIGINSRNVGSGSWRHRRCSSVGPI